MQKVAAPVAGVIAIGLAAWVAFGMSKNADRQFEKGVSSRGSVIAQEVIGAITLTVLAIAFWQVIRVWRGSHAGPLMIFLPFGVFLALLWAFALLAQRAS